MSKNKKIKQKKEINAFYQKVKRKLKFYLKLIRLGLMSIKIYNKFFNKILKYTFIIKKIFSYKIIHIWIKLLIKIYFYYI